MGQLNWVEGLISVLFIALCAMAGALVLMQRAANHTQEERTYDLQSGSQNLIGAGVGGIAGILVAMICVYYYLFSEPSRGWIEWAGRASYLLVLCASSAHILDLIHTWIRLDAEGRDLRAEGPQQATLLLRRRTGLADVKREAESYEELRLRDDDLVAELVGVFGERLLVGQRALSRIPFYGYLGTVCGILIMAQELAGLDEATETFKVLRDMARGLILAFKTTLIALLAYLPLRKVYDRTLIRLGRLERAWLAIRDEEGMS